MGSNQHHGMGSLRRLHGIPCQTSLSVWRGVPLQFMATSIAKNHRFNHCFFLKATRQDWLNKGLSTEMIPEMSWLGKKMLILCDANFGASSIFGINPCLGSRNTMWNWSHSVFFLLNMKDVLINQPNRWFTNFIWLVVWNMALFFPSYWECHHPNCRTHIFRRGRYTTNQLWTMITMTSTFFWMFLSNQMGLSGIATMVFPNLRQKSKICWLCEAQLRPVEPIERKNGLSENGAYRHCGIPQKIAWNSHVHTRWGPRLIDSVQLVQMTPITMIYDTSNYPS